MIRNVLAKVSDPAYVGIVSTADEFLQRVDTRLEEVENVATKFSLCSDDSNGELIQCCEMWCVIHFILCRY